MSTTITKAQQEAMKRLEDMGTFAGVKIEWISVGNSIRVSTLEALEKAGLIQIDRTACDAYVPSFNGFKRIGNKRIFWTDIRVKITK